jgi:agmatine deiminase
MDRRGFLASAMSTATVAGLGASQLAWAGLSRSSSPEWRIPGEFEPTRAVWLDYTNRFKAVLVRMITALLPHARIVLVADDEDEIVAAEELLRELGVDVSRSTVVLYPDIRLFLRDLNLFSVGYGRLGVVDFQWNRYGLPGRCHDLYPDDPERANRCAAGIDEGAGHFDQWVARYQKAQLHSSPLFMEGGAIEVNGIGTLLVSEPLALQRNAGRSVAELERHFLDLPGVRKVIWLGEGVAEDPLARATITGNYVGFGAGSHTDEFVRFADPRTVLLAWVEPHDHPLNPVEEITAKRMQRNFDILSVASDQDGRPFKIIKVPMPASISRPVVLQEKPGGFDTWTASDFPASEGRKAGDRLLHVAAASYLNYIVANDLVLLPSYVEDGTPEAVQERVETIFKDAFPSREIKFINITPLNWQGGGIHCATCNEPVPTTG